jgi:alkylated DNA nucleotide flippase Atl1
VIDRLHKDSDTSWHRVKGKHKHSQCIKVFDKPHLLRNEVIALRYIEGYAKASFVCVIHVVE